MVPREPGVVKEGFPEEVTERLRGREPEAGHQGEDRACEGQKRAFGAKDRAVF